MGSADNIDRQHTVSVPVERVSSGRRTNNNDCATVQRRTNDVARRGDMGDKRKSYTTSIVIAPRGKVG